MSRTPLSTQLREYLIEWPALDWPIDWTLVFGRTAPIDVEIGFGNGGFLAELAAARPEHDFVGVERSLASVQRVFKRIERAGLKNVRLVLGDAVFVVEQLFGPHAIAQLYVNFPDPWPKERHHGRRLIRPVFLDLVGRRLVRNGEVMVATDHPNYAEWIEEAFQAQSALVSVHATPSVASIPGRNPTKYEQKAKDVGATIRYFEWRNAKGKGGEARIERFGEMPNVILRGTFDAARLSKAVGPLVWKGERDGVTVVVKIGETFQETERGHLLVEAMVREGGFAQHLAITVIHRPPSQLLVKLSPIGHPRPTWGVKQTIARVTEKLCEAFPGLKVSSSTLGEPSEHEKAEAG